MTNSCQTCRFWKRSDRVGADHGKCRRHAPRTAHPWDAFTGEAIIAIADIISRHLHIEWPDGIDAEATENTNAAGFPRTYADDWCGEFQNQGCNRA